ncbi:MAG: ABC transporter ATP-binding protein [Anaerolineaceae bacterium]|nr:ABC transporter ATP-binding protein [Anaerolineaceae bacterium]
MNETILDVQDLRVSFYTDEGVVKAVDGVDFQVKKGEVLGLVGESGCGKSVTSFSIMGLVDIPGKIEGGKILFKGKDLLKMSDSQMTAVRGNRISMIFQQPQTSLDPVYTVGQQILEVLTTHNQQYNKEEAWDRVVELLRIVGIPNPEKKAYAYPHQMSGGQAQRVMIAMALALQPEILIADEPTTALDVTIQAQILDLLRGLQNEFNTGVILITHDLGVIAEMADSVAVMYAGRIIERTDVRTLFAEPAHPYTKGLIASVPVIGQLAERLDAIPGNVPNLIDLPPGCRFASRCTACEKYQLSICSKVEPDLLQINSDQEHLVRCWLYQDCESEGHVAPLGTRSSSESK